MAQCWTWLPFGSNSRCMRSCSLVALCNDVLLHRHSNVEHPRCRAKMVESLNFEPGQIAPIRLPHRPAQPLQLTRAVAGREVKRRPIHIHDHMATVDGLDL